MTRPWAPAPKRQTDPLNRTLVERLAPHGLAYLHVVQAGDDVRLPWIREHGPSCPMVNRPGRPRDQIAVDLDARLAAIASGATVGPANPIGSPGSRPARRSTSRIARCIVAAVSADMSTIRRLHLLIGAAYRRAGSRT